MTNLEHFLSSAPFTKIIISVGIIIGGVIINHFLKFLVYRTLRKDQAFNKNLIVKKFLNYFLVFVIIFSIISVWVDNPVNYIMGLLGVIAVGFFAVWSVLSNIVIGFIIMVMKPFAVNDTLVIIPENVSGVIIDYDLMFVKIMDSDGFVIYVPNNILIQRVFKVKSHQNK